MAVAFCVGFTVLTFFGRIIDQLFGIVHGAAAITLAMLTVLLFAGTVAWVYSALEVMRPRRSRIDAPR
jgi:hypothetical protein